jgi:hypothetical protein
MINIMKPNKKASSSVLIILIAMLLILVIIFIGWNTGFAVKNNSPQDNNIITGNLISNQETETESTNTNNQGETSAKRTSSGGGTSSGGTSSGGGGTSNPPESTPSKNEVINIKINSDTEIFAIHLDLEFDNSAVTINKITENFLKKDVASTYPVIEIDNSKGTASYASTRFATQEGVSGEGVLISLELANIKNSDHKIKINKIRALGTDLEEKNVKVWVE